MAENTNYFKKLYSIVLGDKIKKKNNLSYCSWATAWAEVKMAFPDSTYTIYERTTPDGFIVNYFTDGKTCWVKTGVTVNGIEHIEELPVMDFKNRSIPYENITSSDVNKSIQRSLTKACGRHGLGLSLYEGEDIPKESAALEKLRSDCWTLFCNKAKLSDEAKTKANDFCKDADQSGDPRQIEDEEILKTLRKQLLSIRK